MGLADFQGPDLPGSLLRREATAGRRRWRCRMLGYETARAAACWKRLETCVCRKLAA